MKASAVGSLLVLNAASSAAAQKARTRTDATVSNSDIIVEGRRVDELLAPAATGSRLKLTPLETPASVEAIDGDIIRARGDLSIVDAVTRATGVTSNANPGNGGTALASRGFSGSGSVQILYDGVRLYPGAGTTTFPFDPWMASRVEVLRGPASVLYGEGSIGGAINVISRAPTSDFRGQAEVGYGLQNSVRSAAGVGGPIGSAFSYRADVSATRSDGYVDRGDSRSLALSGSFRFSPSDRFTLVLQDDYGDLRPMAYFGTPLVNGRNDERLRRKNYNVADADLHYRDNWTRLTADWRISDTLSFHNVAYRLTTRRTFIDVESYCYVAATGDCPNGYGGGTPGKVYRTDYIGIRHAQTQLGNQGNFSLRTGANDLVVGFDVNDIRFHHTNNSPYPGDSEIDPISFDPGLFFRPENIIPKYRTTTRQMSIYAEDRLKLSDRLSLVGGLRYDRATVRRYNLLAGDTLFAGFPVTFRNVSWRGGAVFQPSPDWSIYGQYATGADPLGSLITTSVAQTAFKQASGRQVEAGVKHSFAGNRGWFTLAVYDIRKSNLLAAITGQPNSSQPVGARSSRGIEAAFTYDFSPRFGVEANAALLDARFEEFNDVSGGMTVSRAGKTPPNVPEQTANLWLRWDPVSKLRARAGVRYVGPAYSDNANLFRIPGYAVVDGSVTYALTEQLSLSARVYNLLDKAYATNAYNDEQWILGRPRSVDLSAAVRF